MVREKHKQPEMQIDDLHPISDGFIHAYTGTATLHGIRAVAYLDIVERDHWPPGRFLSNAYELTCSYERLAKKGPQDTERLRARGHHLVEQLRERMLAAMHEAGWQVVGQTKEGREIWQHRPSFSQEPASAAEVSRDQTPATQASGNVMEVLAEAHPLGQLSSEAKGDDQAGSVQCQIRVYTTRSITFTCVQCGREVTEQRFPSHTPLYCSNPACKKEGNRLKTRARVAKYRRLHPRARKKQSV